LNFALPPEGSANSVPQTLQLTLFETLVKTTCSLPHFGHLMRKKPLVGLGINFSHSAMLSTSQLRDYQLSKADSVFVYREAADFAFQFKCLFLGCLGKFSLERIFLSAVTSLLTVVVAFSLG
jgi:hypothetical protein